MKEVIWLGTSKDDLMEFPGEVQDEMGYALFLTQNGKKNSHIKILTGYKSANVQEIKINDRSGTYRTVYTVEKKEYVFVVHAFHKKSKKEGEVPKKDQDTIDRRLKEVDEEYKKLKNKKELNLQEIN